MAVDGLDLAPFRAFRPEVAPERLGRVLCPPYDVITPEERAALLRADPDNAVGVILPEPDGDLDAYAAAARRLAGWARAGTYRPDDTAALYVYQLRAPDGGLTRGVLGAVALRDAAAGVILPHENTMAAPVADRLALMTATQANLEPIYLIYDGGGATSSLVADIDQRAPIATASTPDGVQHTLWAITDAAAHTAVRADLAGRQAVIADGHHRYATYLELQQRASAERGPGPWDRGLTLLVDSAAYGPQVHAIHRVVSAPLSTLVAAAGEQAALVAVSSVADGLRRAEATPGFAAVLANATESYLLTDPGGRIASGLLQPGEPDALATLDVTVLHRGLVERVWRLPDTVDAVGYAHSVPEALASAASRDATAVLLRPTPVAAVASVAMAGGRMPRKSTLFTPKPASGLVMRRFTDAE